MANDYNSPPLYAIAKLKLFPDFYAHNLPVTYDAHPVTPASSLVP